MGKSDGFVGPLDLLDVKKKQHQWAAKKRVNGAAPKALPFMPLAPLACLMAHTVDGSEIRLRFHTSQVV